MLSLPAASCLVAGDARAGEAVGEVEQLILHERDERRDDDDDRRPQQVRRHLVAQRLAHPGGQDRHARLAAQHALDDPLLPLAEAAVPEDLLQRLQQLRVPAPDLGVHRLAVRERGELLVAEEARLVDVRRRRACRLPGARAGRRGRRDAARGRRRVGRPRAEKQVAQPAGLQHAVGVGGELGRLFGEGLARRRFRD
jgi:hypothetical protein